MKTKTRLVGFRVTEIEFHEIAKQAAIENKSKTTFLRDRAFEKMSFPIVNKKRLK